MSSGNINRKILINTIKSDAANGTSDAVIRLRRTFPGLSEGACADIIGAISEAWETLITSANLSYHRQQGNIEIGTLIESRNIVGQIKDIFEKMTNHNIFIEC